MPDPVTAKLVEPLPQGRRPDAQPTSEPVGDSNAPLGLEAAVESALAGPAPETAINPTEPGVTFTLRGAVERLHASITVMDECIERAARLRKILKGEIPENGSKLDSPPKPVEAKGAMEALHQIISAYEKRITTLITEQTHIEGVL
jgi:hypothetical protein